MTNFEFHSPWFLALFLLFTPLIIKDLKTKKSKGIAVPSIQNMREDRLYFWVRKFLRISKYFVLSALILAMARPRTYSIFQDEDDSKSVDIILAVDVSLSMLARDLAPDRLSALKDIAKNFVDDRSTDRIGLVAYSGEAMAKVPLTTDHQVIKEEIDVLDPMELEPGTAIGEGLSVAVNHLRKSKSKSKIVILMTDGVNTVENAMPQKVAAEMAKDNGIKVYTIGIGTNGFAPFPVEFDVFGDLIFEEQEVNIDDEGLTEIAQMTGGRYFRATSNNSLKEIYDEINTMEQSENKAVKQYLYSEYYKLLLWFGLAILMLEMIMRFRFFKRI